jgi:AraC-like DNA-binding protein
MNESSIIFDIPVALSFAGMGLSLFFGLYVLSRPDRWQPLSLVLLGLLAVSAGQLWVDVLMHARLIYRFPWWMKLDGQGILTLWTLVFVLLLVVTTPDRPLPRWWLLLAVPILIDAAFWAPSFLGFSLSEKRILIDQYYADTRPGPTHLWRNPRLLLVRLVLPLVYLGIGQYRLYRQGSRPSLRLLRLIMWCMIGYVSLEYLLSLGLYAWTGHSFIEFAVRIVWMAVLIALMSFFFLRKQEEKPTPATTLSTDQMGVLITALRQKLQDEQSYRNPDLRQGTLAQELGTNSSYLSQAINRSTGMGFAEFLNQYRVEEARRLLRDPANDPYTIEAIGQRAGFRSKTAFYRAFKKVTGTSPAAYKQS